MNRLEDFYKKQIGLILDNADFQTDDKWAEAETIFAADLTGGQIDKPEWLCLSEGTDHLKIWDEEEGSIQMGYITVSY
jgi:hypothetical protein